MKNREKLYNIILIIIIVLGILIGGLFWFAYCEGSWIYNI